jgi:prepilin-type processing-associated H-X9-DG protein
MTVCKQCGAQAAENAAFCAQCGASLGSAAAPPSPQFTAPPVDVSQGRKKTPTWVWILVPVLGVLCLCPVVLAAILFPVFQQARNQAKAAASLSRAKQVDLAVLMYVNDSNDVYPPFTSAEDMAGKLTPYFKGPGATPEGTQALQTSARSYVWNLAISGGIDTTLPEPSTAWLLHSKDPDETGKFDVAFADGHVKRVSSGELTAITSKPTEISNASSASKN